MVGRDFRKALISERGFPRCPPPWRRRSVDWRDASGSTAVEISGIGASWAAAFLFPSGQHVWQRHASAVGRVATDNSPDSSPESRRWRSAAGKRPLV